ncbi:MAG: DUF89 family protein [Candidatus Eisenbacteria bacterium]|nr:DUF89 family protein [Candidatus Eisenbacteria bacterium]
MRTYLDCYPCFMRQALDALGRITEDEEEQLRILQGVTEEIASFDPTSTPPEMAQRIHRILRRETGLDDPYREAKEESTRHALALYPELKRIVEESDDPLETAIRVSVAGNIIDLGATAEYDLEGGIERALKQDFAVHDIGQFRARLAETERLLFLGDNAGETVFDRVLIETLGRPVDYAVRGAPVINDATREDAAAAGLDRVAHVIDNGSDAPGTLLPFCSEEFRTVFHEAGLILAKGQGNYESLSEEPAPLFYLLQTKCPVIARDLGVPVQSLVFKRNGAGDAERSASNHPVA